MKQDNETKHEASIDDLTATVRRSTTTGLNVDVHDDFRKASLLIQSGPGGYQLDLWWKDGDRKRQSNNWVNFGPKPSDYPYDNRHERDLDRVTVEAEEADGRAVIRFNDPDPRAKQMGYGDADLTVMRHEKGYTVRLDWTDESDTRRFSEAIIPLVDPREDRDGYYQFIEPVAENEEVEP